MDRAKGLTMTELPFWERKSLAELSGPEWESLCDGCGKCCLLKLEDEDTGEIAYTRLHCKLFDGESCRCSDYENRFASVPDCVKLTPDNLSTLRWMPESCAYRRVWEGKPLPDWHHLITGRRDSIHEAGQSVRGRTVSEDAVIEEDQMDWIVDWEGNPP